jgi:nitrate/nitrite transporter NarK
MTFFFIWLTLCIVATIVLVILNYKYNDKYPAWWVFIMFILLLVASIPIGEYNVYHTVDRIGRGKAVIEIDRIETNAQGDTLNITYKLVEVKK